MPYSNNVGSLIQEVYRITDPRRLTTKGARKPKAKVQTFSMFLHDVKTLFPFVKL